MVLEECAQLCERQNATLHGAYRDDGAISTGYGFQHCNAWTFDAETKQCFLKNKRQGNFSPMVAPLTPPCAFYNPRAAAGKGPRWIFGYRWSDLVNEINDPFPNMTSGMAHNQDSNPNWSKDNWGVTGQYCTKGESQCHPFSRGRAVAIAQSYCVENTRALPTKPPQYYVQPGALLSPKNVTSGPFAFHPARANPTVASFQVASMQECANAASKLSHPMGPYTGVNAWTFHPQYTTANAANGSAAGQGPWPGTCRVGNVREPYFQTLTPHDNGAISGYNVATLSTENHRFMFG